MVASRKPKPASRRPRPRKKRETLEEKLQRILAEPADAPFPKLTRREAVALARKLAERPPDTSSPDGSEQVKRFYGLWPEPETDADYPD